jgi:hypothetical protein
MAAQHKNKRNLCRILREHVDHYPTCPTHRSLSKDSPKSRTVQPSDLGKVVAFPFLVGLHHRYGQKAA